MSDWQADSKMNPPESEKIEERKDELVIVSREGKQYTVTAKLTQMCRKVSSPYHVTDIKDKHLRHILSYCQ